MATPLRDVAISAFGALAGMAAMGSMMTMKRHCRAPLVVIACSLLLGLVVTALAWKPPPPAAPETSQSTFALISKFSDTATLPRGKLPIISTTSNSGTVSMDSHGNIVWTMHTPNGKPPKFVTWVSPTQYMSKVGSNSVTFNLYVDSPTSAEIDIQIGKPQLNAPFSSICLPLATKSPLFRSYNPTQNVALKPSDGPNGTTQWKAGHYTLDSTTMGITRDDGVFIGTFSKRNVLAVQFLEQTLNSVPALQVTVWWTVKSSFLSAWTETYSIPSSSRASSLSDTEVFASQ